jgi:hypothetical protein
MLSSRPVRPPSTPIPQLQASQTPQYHGSFTPNTLARPLIRGIHSPKRCYRRLSDQPRTLTPKNAFHVPQQQQPTRAQHPPTRRPSIASYQPTLPNESRMPDEWGYPSSSMPHFSSAPFSRMHPITHNTLTDMPRNIRGVAAPITPTCCYPNCLRPVTRDERTHELTEYCSPEHMRFVVLVLQGSPRSCSLC